MLLRPILIGLVIALGTPLKAARPWLPFEEQWIANVSFSYTTFDEFYQGTTKVKLADEQEEFRTLVGVEYGLNDSIAFDVTLGYSVATFDPNPNGDQHGLDDTRLGVRWRFLNEDYFEEEWIPTLTMRVGAIIEGTYEVQTNGATNSVGDGASGAEVELAWGKRFDSIGFGFYGAAGFRARNENVPEDFLLNLGIYKNIIDEVTLTFSYRRQQSLSGLDIGGPGFTPDRFPELKEISDTINGGIYYNSPHGHSYGFTLGHVLDGRNVGDKFIFQVSTTFRF
ncbi:MAG: hypothetical protein AAGA18_02895 [Verrucomicrobiota bacterium]